MSPLFAQTLMNAGGVLRGLRSVRPPSSGGRHAGEAGHLLLHAGEPDWLSLVWPWLVALLAVALAGGVVSLVVTQVIYPAFARHPRYATERPDRYAWGLSIVALVVVSLPPSLGYSAWKGWRDRTRAEYAVAEADRDAARAVGSASEVHTETAVATLDRALELNPDHPHLHAARAVAHNLRKDYDRCLDDLAVAVDRNPAEKKYREYRAELLTRLGRHDEAVADRARLFELDPSMSALHRWTDALKAAGQLEAADRAEAAGVARLLDGEHPDDVTSRIWLVNAAVARGLADRVAPAVERWVADAGADREKRAGALDNRAAVRFGRKDYAGAIADWGEAMTLRPEYPREVFRARAQVRLKDYRAAVAELDAGAKRPAHDWLARVELAWLRATCPDGTIRDAKAAREQAAAGVAGLGKHFAELDDQMGELRAPLGRLDLPFTTFGGWGPFQFPREPANPASPLKERWDSRGGVEWHSRLLTAAVEAESGNVPEARRLLAEMHAASPRSEPLLPGWSKRYGVLARAIDAGRPVRDPGE
jgi:tetratricopeptide (TPR) repeat protein